jgi:hypothetical protein
MLKNFLFAILVFTNFSLFAEQAQGEALEKEMWEYIKGQKWDELEKKIAPYFQAVEFDGAHSKEQYLIRAKKLNISDYKMNEFIVTEGPGLKVITYSVEVSETIEGKRITANAERLSVWQENNGNWQWIAHAILIPVPATGTL